MDTTAEQDRIAKLPLAEPDVEHPLPIVLSKDGTVVLSYMAWLGRKHSHIVVTFHVAFGHRFGPPDAPGVASHPLAARGLKRDMAVEVKDSSWVRDAFGGRGRHYVFTFKDGMFECAAEGFGSETIDEDADVVRLMARRLYK